ncbi:MAG TPA: transglycosylase domain-containing protein [Candidatus Saccharimonadales bacterium]|nr:transglycosylase domain-containing protein [Candidatus Saccharimonadales bacterium]
MAKTVKSGGKGRGKNVYVTRSGKSIKVNRSLTDRLKFHNDSRARRRATRLSALPKSRVKRFIYRLQPKRLAAYWFSRDGLIMGLKLFGVGIVVLFVLLVGLFAYFRKDLPKLNNISGGNLAGSVTYYDRTGKIVLFQDYNAYKRVPVEGSQISTYMKDATVAIEDKNFYHEGGFSTTGIIRAAFDDLFHRSEGLQGGSTITEQVVKLNENWTDQRSIPIKIKEIILAVDLSREYSKSDILTGYLNVAPYGGIDYGVQAAAEDYFGESAAQLDLAQSAMMAAIPQDPPYYSPYSSPQFNAAATENLFGETALITRQHYILDQMVKQGYVTQSQANQAMKENVLAEVQPEKDKYNNIVDPYFVLAAKKQLDGMFGQTAVNRGGWKVITTLSVPLQNLANNLVQQNLPNVEHDNGDEEALAGEDVKTGQMVAEVGGVNFNNPTYGQINYADNVLIPPGSSFKPYDYSSLINDTTDTGAGSVLYDVQQPLDGYPCTDKTNPNVLNPSDPTGSGKCLWDYDYKYPGAEELRYALAGSRNVPAVKAMLTVGVNKVISTADALMAAPNGYNCYADTALTIPTQCYASAAIGDGAYLYLDQHVNGDASLARLGAAIPTTFILQVQDSTGNTLYQWKQPKATQVVRPDAAYIVDNILSDPKASYLPGSCTETTCTPLSDDGYKWQRYNGWDIAVKTGTENYDFDGLMTAWSTQFAVTTWVGYHTQQIALTAGQMEYLTEPLARGWMQGALDTLNEKPVNWVQPSDIKVLPSFVQRNHIDFGDEEPGPSTDLFPSWYVQPKTTSSTQTIDKLSGDVATSCTPQLAQEIESGGNASEFSADIFWPINQSSSSAAAAGTTDPIHSCSDPPLVAPSLADQSLVIDDPTSGNAITPDASGNYDCNTACNILVNPTSLPPANTMGSTPYPRYPIKVNLLVNGQVSSTQQIASSGSTATLTFTYTPPSTAVQLSVQLIDNALYSATSNNIPVIESTSGP